MPPTRVQPAPHVHFTEIEGDLVLMDLARGVYLGLDPVASHIWRSLEGSGETETAVAAVCARFEVAPDQARADVEAWVAQLVARDLLRPVALNP